MSDPAVTIRKHSLLILRTGEPAAPVLERHGQFARWIERGIGRAWPGEIVELDLREGLPREALSAGAWVITGSASSVTEREGWMLAAESLLREALERGLPVLGLCFGHQLMAQALGGLVVKNPKGREMGTVRVRKLAHDPMFEGLGDEFWVNSTHVDTVARLPEGAQLLADTSLDATSAFVVGSGRGVQFHPEIDGEVMRAYLEARRHLLLDEGLPADQMLASASDTPAGERILQNFARLAAAAVR